MADSANEPVQEEKKPVPRWIWWVCGVFALALLCFLFYGQPAERAIRTKNFLRGKSLFPAIKMYAHDHDGQYPRSLSELVPDYLGSVETSKYQDRDSQRRFDWFYIQSLSETSPATWIVLASPTEQISGDRERRERIVIYNSGIADILPTGKFNALFAEQMKAMAAQAP